jgi:hypothetical protein
VARTKRLEATRVEVGELAFGHHVVEIALFFFFFLNCSLLPLLPLPVSSLRLSTGLWPDCDPYQYVVSSRVYLFIYRRNALL